MFFMRKNYRQHEVWGRKMMVEVSIKGADFDSDLDIIASAIDSDGYMVGGIDNVTSRRTRNLKGVKMYRMHSRNVLTVSFTIDAHQLPKKADLSFRLVKGPKVIMDDIKLIIRDSKGNLANEWYAFNPRQENQTVAKVRPQSFSFKLMESFGHPVM